jgi:hypothetical protein
LPIAGNPGPATADSVPNRDAGRQSRSRHGRCQVADTCRRAGHANERARSNRPETLSVVCARRSISRRSTS